MRLRLDIDREKMRSFCHRWKIAELSFFGSVLRSDFSPDSDVDVLVAFTPEADWSLLDHALMEEELGDLLGRKVDLVSRRGLERSSNEIRRDAILTSAEPFFDTRS